MAREVIQLGSKGETVKALQAYLVKLELLSPNGVDGDFGGTTDVAVRKFQSSHGLEVDGVVSKLTWDKLTEGEKVEEDDPAWLVKRSQAEYVFNVSVSQNHLEKLNKSLAIFKINTPDRIKHFLAQIGHESGGLQWLEEIADGSDYEGREDLGNTEPGDGMRFKGVDPLQVTGRYNYQKLSKYLDDPRVMEGVDYVVANYTFLPSGFWWHDNDMNAFVDSGASCREVSARVNGADPANGLDDRLDYFARALEVITDVAIAEQATPTAATTNAEVAITEQATPTAAPTATPTATPTTPATWTLDNIIQDAPIIPGGNFTWAEATKEGSRMPPDQEILEGIIRIAASAQKARDFLGKQFNITSWYRDPESNADAGGAADSRHLYGDALDFWIDGMTGAEIYALLDDWWEGGLGQYGSFPFLCHIDARGYKARWEH